MIQFLAVTRNVQRAHGCLNGREMLLGMRHLLLSCLVLLNKSYGVHVILLPGRLEYEGRRRRYKHVGLYAAWGQYENPLKVKVEYDTVLVAAGPIELLLLNDTGLHVSQLVAVEPLIKILPETCAPLTLLGLHDVVLGRHRTDIAAAWREMLACLNEVGHVQRVKRNACGQRHFGWVVQVYREGSSSIFSVS